MTRETDIDRPPGPSLPPGGQYLTKNEVLDFQWKAISALPDKQGWPFKTGMLALSVNSSFTGLVALSFFRRMMKVRTAFVMSSLPLAIVPFISTAMSWHAFINVPLLTGEVNCPVCIQIRGGVVNTIMGAVYPTLLAAPLVSALAARYKTVDLPMKHGIVGLYKYYSNIGRHMKTRFITIALYQFVLGYYIATKEYQVYKKLGSPFLKVKEDDMY